MAHGHPDWGQATPMSTVYSVIDHAELAERLGSAVSADRLGNVLVADDFRAGLAGFQVEDTSVGGYVGITTRNARSGHHAVALSGGTTAGRQVGLSKYVPWNPKSSVGLEFHITLSEDVTQIRGLLYAVAGAATDIYRFRYDVAGGQLSVRTDPGVDVVLATLIDLDDDPIIYHDFKMVADVATGYYSRVRIDGTTYDASAVLGQHTVVAAPVFLRLRILVYAGAAVPEEFYIDDVILTQNEP